MVDNLTKLRNMRTEELETFRRRMRVLREDRLRAKANLSSYPEDCFVLVDQYLKNVANIDTQITIEKQKAKEQITDHFC